MSLPALLGEVKVSVFQDMLIRREISNTVQQAYDVNDFTDQLDLYVGKLLPLSQPLLTQMVSHNQDL